MADKSKNSLFGFSPAHYGIASVIAGCLSFAIVWAIFNQGPDGAFNTQLPLVAIYLLLLFGVVCGLPGVIAGINHKKWLGSVIATLGISLNGLFEF